MDQLLQRLRQDGVDMQRYTQKNDSYYGCPECHDALTLDKLIPTLLKCGHVCCQECATKGQKICFICCNKKNIKMLKYSAYLNPVTVQKYGILISIEGKKYQHLIQNVPGDNTVETVLKYYNEFNQFFQTTRESQILVEIGTSKMDYKRIKETAIGKYLKSNVKQTQKIKISLKKNRSYGGAI